MERTPDSIVDNLVFDASALLAFLRNEQGIDTVRDLLKDPSNRCFIHAVNLCEIYYDVLRNHGEAIARQMIDDLLTTPLLLRDDMDRPFWEQLGRYKAAHRIALGDCFGLALTHRLSAAFVTADHEIDPIDQRGILPIRFIR
ncbi:MAG: type II toxin-antitoxin system VapC family toxin [Armatimonadetes bacterium]|nr:type II toxin-antitoxin system VapC family toxin [Armatimonadota bacterium]